MTSEAPKLLPCPFCGGTASIYETSIDSDTQINAQCKSCGAEIGFWLAWVASDTEKASALSDVLARWNARDTTHAQAMVAAAYEDAAGIAQDVIEVKAMAAPSSIRARTPDDSQAALDALLKAERVKGRVEGLKEAAKWSCSIPTGVPDHYAQAVVDMNEHWKDAILALIEKETGHE